MSTGHVFRRIKRQGRAGVKSTAGGQGTLREFLSDRIANRFTRLTGLEVLGVPVDLTALEDAYEPPEMPSHPTCQAFAGSPYCREAWSLHLAELKHRPETHWHRCDYGRRCAVAPVVCDGRCIAAVNLVCRDSMSADSFERNAELLDALVEGAAASEHELLTRSAPPARATTAAQQTPARDPHGPREVRPDHPQVQKALDRIKEELSDPALTVGHIANELGMNSDYLSHLFATQVGQHMRRFIAERRIEQAKKLLATTDRQVKRIARDTGHANPNWFSHVFHAHAGLSPSDYRRKMRRRRGTAPAAPADLS